MRPKVVVALPAKCSSSVKDHIERGLREKHPFIDFDFKDDANIKCPQARGLEPNGVNLGTINGDPVKALTAQIEGFHREANELFRIGLERDSELLKWLGGTGAALITTGLVGFVPAASAAVVTGVTGLITAQIKRSSFRERYPAGFFLGMKTK